MESKQFKELLSSLKKIEEKLDLLVKLTKASLPKPNVTPEESKILKLCNQKHTIIDIAKETGKSENNVSVLLTSLRNEGIISTVKVKGRLVYRRIR